VGGPPSRATDVHCLDNSVDLLRVWSEAPPGLPSRAPGCDSRLPLRPHTGRGPGPGRPPKPASGVQLLGGLSPRATLPTTQPPWRSLEFSPACHAGDRGCKSRWGRRASLGEPAEPPARGAGVSGCKSRGKHRGVEQHGQLGRLITCRSRVRIPPPPFVSLPAGPTAGCLALNQKVGVRFPGGQARIPSLDRRVPG
jgi:hypothetical protein